MSPNSLWTPIKFTLSSSIPYCSGPSSSHLEYIKNRLLSIPPSDANLWADRAVSSLIRRVALECMPYYPNAIPLTLFLCWINCLQFHTAKTNPLEHGLAWCNHHNTTWPLSVSPFKDSQSTLSLLSKAPLYLWPRPL